MMPPAAPLTDADKALALAQARAYFGELLARHRVEAVWFIREDWLPETPADCLKACRYLQRAVNRPTWQELEYWRRWLLQHYSGESATS